MDDILGEESDNESEGRGKEKPGNEDIAEEEEGEEQQQGEPGAGESAARGPDPKADGVEERPQTTPPSDSSLAQNAPRWGANILSYFFFFFQLNIYRDENKTKTF